MFRNNREKILLAAIIAAGILVRVFTIWIGRPEFAGWFNHTYYYFVEVRGILENGSMPFGDLPLLFYFYALIARIMIFFGAGTEFAVVNSTRLVMSVVPALTALPVFAFLKSLNAGQTLRFRHWLLVFSGAFLPLSLTHMPELLQKNALGLLLFTALLTSAYSALKRSSPAKIGLIIVIAVLIVLTHLGTLIAAGLFGIALAAALFLTERDVRKTGLAVSAIVLFSAGSLSAVYLFDPARFGRIFVFIKSSVTNSLLGLLFSGSDWSEKLQVFAAIVFPILIIYFLYRIYRNRISEMPKADKIFWLANIIFCYFIGAPIIDTDVIPRLILFLIIPVIFILGFYLKYSERQWVNLLLPAALSLCLLVMTFGEVMGAVMRNGNHAAVYKEITALAEKQKFSSGDLIITKYGVTEICNWFFKTKSTLITSFNKNDLEKYDRVFILVPVEGEENTGVPSDEAETGLMSDADKYRLTRRNVLIPAEMEPVYETEHFRLFEIEKPPQNWKFDGSGNWAGYQKVK
ncbi:MAG: hypothetical protein R2681_06405 [Pyrinomonadaceae bacterium]